MTDRADAGSDSQRDGDQNESSAEERAEDSSARSGSSIPAPEPFAAPQPFAAPRPFTMPQSDQGHASPGRGPENQAPPERGTPEPESPGAQSPRTQSLEAQSSGESAGEPENQPSGEGTPAQELGPVQGVPPTGGPESEPAASPAEESDVSALPPSGQQADQQSSVAAARDVSGQATYPPAIDQALPPQPPVAVRPPAPPVSGQGAATAGPQPGGAGSAVWPTAQSGTSGTGYVLAVPYVPPVTSGLASGGLASGILSLVLGFTACCWWPLAVLPLVAGIAGLVMGYQGRRQALASSGQVTGSGLGLAAMIVSGVGVGVTLVMLMAGLFVQALSDPIVG